MKISVWVLLLSIVISNAFGQDVSSPDANLKVSVSVDGGKPVYSVTYKGKAILENSPLGLVTNEGDFSTGMKYDSKTESKVDKNYTQDKIKRSQIHYVANRVVFTFENEKKNKINIEFQVSNNDIAFRYEILPMGERLACVVEKEVTGFKFPSATTTYLSGMMTPMTGYANGRRQAA